MKKVDICIAFNDATPPDGIGMVARNKPSYYHQTVNLVKSIIVNWDKNKIDYDIYIFHSREVEEDKIKKLKNMNCFIIYDENETQPFLNKENIYKYKTDGDYTLVLDSDMIVLRTPKLCFEKDIYMMPEGVSPNLNENQWKILFEKMSAKYVESEPKHFNGGCIFINNLIKKDFYNLFEKYIDVLGGLEKENRHFSIQYYYSALLKCFDWGELSPRLNYFSRFLKNNKDPDADIVHYLGIHGYNEIVKNIVMDIEEKYDKRN